MTRFSTLSGILLVATFGGCAADSTDDPQQGGGKGDSDVSSCGFNATRAFRSDNPNELNGPISAFNFTFERRCAAPYSEVISGDLPNGWSVGTSGFHGPQAELEVGGDATFLGVAARRLESRFARTFVDQSFGQLGPGATAGIRIPFSVEVDAPDEAWIAVGFRPLAQTNGMIDPRDGDYLDFDHPAIQWAQVDVGRLREIEPGPWDHQVGGGFVRADEIHCGIGQCPSPDPLQNRGFVLRPLAMPASTGAFAAYFKVGELPNAATPVNVNLQHVRLEMTGAVPCVPYGGYEDMHGAITSNDGLDMDGEIAQGKNCQLDMFTKFAVKPTGFTTLWPRMDGPIVLEHGIVRADGTPVNATVLAREGGVPGLRVSAADVTDGSGALYLQLVAAPSGTPVTWAVEYDVGN